VKAIAVLGRRRTALMPPLPTADEQGLTGFDAVLWYGIFLPKDTPAEIVQKLNVAVIATLDTPSLQERMKQVGAELAASDQRSSEYLGKLVESEIVKWAGPIKASGVTAD